MSLADTAEKLFLHKNTLQYKLNHIYKKMWSQSPEIPGRCSVVSGAGAGIKGPFLQKVFQFLQPLYHMICFMRSSHIFQVPTSPSSPRQNQQVSIPAACPPAISAVRESPMIIHSSALIPGELFQTLFKKTYIRLVHTDLLRYKTMIEIFQHIGFFQPADLLLIRAVAGRAQNIFSL